MRSVSARRSPGVRDMRSGRQWWDELGVQGVQPAIHLLASFELREPLELQALLRQWYSSIGR